MPYLCSFHLITDNIHCKFKSSQPSKAMCFLQIFVVGSERRMCFETECIMALQGHPRSLILAPIESAYATSYWSSIVTLVLSSPFQRYCIFSAEKSDPTLIPPEFCGCSPWTRLPTESSVQFLSLCEHLAYYLYSHTET